jgi:formylglycine-generating enzyme required for sulfatase activity
MGRLPPDEEEHLALFRLPWFRSGWMPEDLRLALIQHLDLELRPVVRTAIEALLFNALDDDKRDPDAAPRLDFARPPQGWWAVLRAWMEGSPAGTPARDAIFVSYMMGRVPKPADLRLNRRLARLFGARLAGWFDRRTIAYVVLAIGASIAIGSFADTLVRPLFTRSVATTVTAPAMVALPGGTFLMGSPESEEGRDADEGPQHEVTIRPFAIGKYKVTFAEWGACAAAGGCNGYRPDDRGWGRGRRPLINVSWKDARAYCEWLANVTGQPYRLPSEAEWEYAARAGTKTGYAFGDEITKKDANFGLNVGKTTEVSAHPASPWGLYDMHGNVWEWVADIWHPDYHEGAPADGSAWIEPWAVAGAFRVLRGGSWSDEAPYLRSAYRLARDPGYRSNSIGFRCARTQP